MTSDDGTSERYFDYVLKKTTKKERLIGTIRREYFGCMLFWTSAISRINCSGGFRTASFKCRHLSHHHSAGRPDAGYAISHHPSPICARFAGGHTVDVYFRHPWPLEFSRCAFLAICRSPWAQTRNEIIRVGDPPCVIATRFVNLAVSLQLRV